VCFSAEADFAVAAVLAPVGVATLRHVRRPAELLLGGLPLLLALHQLTEGFVWLGLQGSVSAGVRDAATGAYLAVAQVVLPVLVPLGVLALESDRARRAAMAALALVGAAVAARFAWILTAHPLGAQALDHVVVYDTDIRFGYLLGAAYVAATCGPALLSSSSRLRWFGALNVLGLTAASLVRLDAVTSVWCVYAALVSVLVLAHFRARHA
jgi:hypothetical protein